MALVLENRVQETGTANTTVSFTLTGAAAGFQTFAVIGNTNTTYYAATDASGNWEVGLGTYSTTGPTLTRTTVYASSNSGSAVTFSGTCNIFVTYPSGRAVYEDASGNVSALGTISSATWQGTTIGVAYGGTGVTASSGASSVVLRDTNQNVVFNNFIAGFAATTASAGTTVLTVASARNQILVGSTTHTFQMPDATTLQLGQSFLFVNNSSGVLTITNNASATIDTIPSGGVAQLGATNIGTSAGTFGIYSFLPGTYNFNDSTANFGTATITNTTYQGGTIASGYGGTGLTTFAGANNALYSTSASALAAGTLPVAAGGTGVTSSTGTGSVVLSTSPSLTTPVLGTPSSGTLTSCTGLPLTTGVTGTLPVANGGTGATTATAYAVQCGGTTSTGAHQSIASVGTSGQVLTSNGAGALPTFQAAAGATITGTTTSATYYVIGTTSTSGSLTTASISNTNVVSYNASNGALSAVSHVSSSDERTKTNWRGVAPDFIEQLAGVKSGIFDRTDFVSTEAGVSAQSLQKVLAEAVVAGEDGMLSVNYGGAALVAAIKLAERVVALEARLAALEK